LTFLKTQIAPLFLLFTIFSCNSIEEETPNWSKIDLATSSDLSAITICNDGAIHIVGGDLWYSGVYVFSPFGESWSVETILNKQLIAIDQDQTGNLYATGVDGYRLNKSCENNWQIEQPLKWGFMRDLDFEAKGNGILVGGEALTIGFMVRVSQDGSIEITDWDRELSSITSVSEEIYILTGYGFVSKSVDDGKTWVQSEIGGDFFVDCIFPTDKVGYIVGSYGTILKTTDQGESWEKVRNGYSLTVSDLPFNAIFFTDANTGYVCGDGGLVIVTRDGGASWSKFEGLPSIDFLDVAAIGNTIYVCGEEGTLLRIDE